MRRRYRPPLTVSAIPFLLLVLFLAAGCAHLPAPAGPPAPAAAKKPVPGPRGQVLGVVAVGDIMLGTDYPKDLLPPEGAQSELEAMKPVLAGGDITFGNLEGVLAADTEPVKKCHDESHCYLFRSPPDYAQILHQAGFTVLGMGNNHSGDFGIDGRAATIAALDAAGLQHSGREGDVATWTVKGKRVALVAFAPNAGTWPLLDIGDDAALIARLKCDHDIVIVSFHGGAEGPRALHVPFRHEYYFDEDRGDVVQFAHVMIEAGADLLLGQGPHVPRAFELYRGRLIAYSLGNFATSWGISVDGPAGFAPVLVAKLAGDGRFLSGEVVSAVQIRPHGPVPDSQQQAYRLIQNLTEQDFYGGGLRFMDDGHFTPDTLVPGETRVLAGCGPSDHIGP